MDYSLLPGISIFNGYSKDDLEKILARVPFRLRKFRAGSIIAHSGEPVDSLIIVIKGNTKGEMVDYTGRIIKIEDIPAPGALASAFIFSKKNRFPVNVMAVSDGELMIIERSEFLRLMIKYDRILVNFLEVISSRSQFLSEKIKFLNFKTIKGKLAQFLLQKAGKDGPSFILDVTQNDIADFFGVARPSIARALGEMEKDGYIDARGKNIRIIDKIKLAELTID